ncbi:MAG: hypothetical protein LBJ11_08675 [Oscillospiraceae bacterium]|jgi:alpha-tubulin suppressor-like RCC1 family protein|nr:hypothetical protein [Oscillospiraceae bacterium]
MKLKRILPILLALSLVAGAAAVLQAASAHQPAFQTAPQVVAGEGQNYLLKSDGTVWAWGDAAYTLWSSPSVSYFSVPQQVLGLTNVKSIAAGYDHAVALKDDGTVWSWGYWFYGQFGDGNYDSAFEADTQGLYADYLNLTPTQANISGVTAIAAGDGFTAALKSNGTGGWGDPTEEDIGEEWLQPTPAQATITGVTAIAAGADTLYALKSDGTVWAWGGNFGGALGLGVSSSAADRFTPGKISSLSGITAIFANEASSAFALKNNGTLYAWGYNKGGQLGDGSSTNRTAPVTISLSNTKSVSASGNTAVAVKTDGTVWTWGTNSSGALGTGNASNTAKSLTPQQVPGLSGVVSADTRIASVLAAKSDGTFWAWGQNTYGQLGNGSSAAQNSVPVRVTL